MITSPQSPLPVPFPPQKKNYIIFALIIFLVISTGAAYYFYSQLTSVTGKPNQDARAEVKALVAKVGQLILLPDGEDPTVATVVDPERLKDQPFFAKTKKGDKVLIYTGAKKAVLYNPESNKIIEVAPVSIGNPPAAPPPTTAPPTPKK